MTAAALPKSALCVPSTSCCQRHHVDSERQVYSSTYLAGTRLQGSQSGTMQRVPRWAKVEGDDQVDGLVLAMRCKDQLSVPTVQQQLSQRGS